MYFDDLKAPYGYPQILFFSEIEGNFFLSPSLADAKKRAKDSEPARYFDFINNFSHSELGKFLKNIGSYWVTRGGIFFFKV